MVPIPLIVIGGVALVGGVAAWLRSRTGAVAALVESDVHAMAKSLCDALGGIKEGTPEEIAARVGVALRPAVSWPPPPALADASHVEAWDELVGWVDRTLALARDEDLELCEFLSTDDGITQLGFMPGTLKPPPANPPLRFSAVVLNPAPNAEVSDIPHSNVYWKIVQNSSLTGAVRSAYDLANGDSRVLRAIRGVVRHPWNAGYRVPGTTDFDKNYLGELISFKPSFKGGQGSDRANPGNTYATIYFPTLEEALARGEEAP